MTNQLMLDLDLYPEVEVDDPDRKPVIETARDRKQPYIIDLRPLNVGADELHVTYVRRPNGATYTCVDAWWAGVFQDPEPVVLSGIAPLWYVLAAVLLGVAA